MTTKTKRPPPTAPDDPVSRDVILAMAERCRRSGNVPLRDLLLTVAGMVALDGRVIDTEWRTFCRHTGPYGIGLMLANRHRYGADEEPVRGGLAALDALARSQAHGWSYATIGELGLSEDAVSALDTMAIATVGELVIMARSPAIHAWTTEQMEANITTALDRFRATLTSEQQAAFDLARRPPEPRAKKAKKVKEAS